MIKFVSYFTSYLLYVFLFLCSEGNYFGMTGAMAATLTVKMDVGRFAYKSFQILRCCICCGPRSKQNTSKYKTKTVVTSKVLEILGFHFRITDYTF